MAYFVWRVMVGLHDSVELNFMYVGHTKFVPDLCFDLLKRKFKREVADCIADIASVVERSAPEKGTNISQVAGFKDGLQCLPTRDWRAFFDTGDWIPVKGVHSLHLFSIKK